MAWTMNLVFIFLHAYFHEYKSETNLLEALCVALVGISNSDHYSKEMTLHEIVSVTAHFCQFSPV